jgi:hypothetical protein
MGLVYTLPAQLLRSALVPKVRRAGERRLMTAGELVTGMMFYLACLLFALSPILFWWIAVTMN